MDLAQALLKRANDAVDKSYEESRGTRRLTVIAFGDLPGYVGFTFWEARARGWTPTLAGRINADDGFAITFCAHPTVRDGLDQLAGFLEQTDPALVAERRPRVLVPALSAAGVAWK